jgi:copper transport protein
MLVMVTGGTGLASAHAALESTTPTEGAVLARPPGRVLLRFGEAVRLPPSAVEVYDHDLREVDRGRPGHLTGRGDVVGVRLAPHLPAGTYTVTYRVISADSHPVSGGFRFSVGHPSAAAPAAQARTSHSGGSGAALMATARWAGYAGAMLGLGSLAVLLVWWPSGRRDRRARTLIWAGWGLLVVGGLGQLLVEGPYTAGKPVSALLEPSLLAGTISLRFGQVLLARLGLLVLLAGWLAVVLHRGGRLRRPLAAGGLPMGLGVLLSFSLAGHAATGDLVALSVASDLAHLVAMSLWLGGLALLASCLLARRRAGDLAAVLPGFSRLATVCLAALVITGGYQTWRDVRYLPAFIHTTYGVLLMAKIGVVLCLAALGALAHRWVARYYRPRTGLFSPALTAYARGAHPGPASSKRPTPTPTATAVRGLRRGLAAETLVAAVVLALTAVLTGTAQAAEAYSPTYRTEVATAGRQLHVTAEPAHVGPATLTVALRDAGGTAVPVEKVTGSLTLPAEHVGPLPVSFHTHRAGASARTDFPTAGSWLLDISVQTSPTSAVTYRIRIPVV